MIVPYVVVVNHIFVDFGLFSTKIDIITQRDSPAGLLKLALHRLSIICNITNHCYTFLTFIHMSINYMRSNYFVIF